MKKILCPTDFSEVALNAIAYAAKFSKESGAQLTLFYVDTLEKLSNAELIRGKSMTVEAEAEKLEEICQDIRVAYHIPCNSDIRASSESIPKLISKKAEGYDLIIMGTKGADDLFKNFLGSNTYRVIQSATVPVLYVPEGYKFDGIKSVVYAFNYLKDYKLPLNQLKPWTKIFNPKVTVLQITEKLDEQEEYKLKEIQRLIINENAEDISLNFETLLDDHVAESIDEYATHKSIDILALCTHHYGAWESLFHKSVIKTISNQANYPVFVFHG